MQQQNAYLINDCIFEIHLKLSFIQVICIILNIFF